MPPLSSRDTETQWLAAARRGDRSAFGQLYEAHRDRVYSLARHLAGEEEAARDLSQRVFVKAFLSLKRFRGDASFATWLHRMVVNLWIDEVRKRRRVSVESLSEAIEASIPAAERSDAQAKAREQRQAIQRAVGTLSGRLRAVFLLKYVAEMSYQEIAETLGCSVGTVSSRLHRSLKLLARELDHLRGGAS